MAPPRNPAEDELDILIGSAQRSLFRLETLPAYAVESDGGDFAAYLAGEPGPDPDRKAAYHAVLQADLDRGISTRKVHVVNGPLTDYQRYEFEWCHVLDQPFEDIRVVDLAGGIAPASLAETGDFWVIDDDVVALMHYDEAGRFAGFTRLPSEASARARIVAGAAWAYGTPFGAWWDDHRQFWRERAAA